MHVVPDLFLRAGHTPDTHLVNATVRVIGERPRPHADIDAVLRMHAQREVSHVGPADFNAVDIADERVVALIDDGQMRPSPRDHDTRLECVARSRRVPRFGIQHSIPCAQNVAFIAGRTTGTADDLAVTGDIVELHPGFHSHVVSRYRPDITKGPRLLVNAVKVQAVAGRDHGRCETALIAVGSPMAVHGIGANVVGLPLHDPSQRAAEGPRATAVGRVAVRNRRASGGVPAHPAGRHRCLAFVGHITAALGRIVRDIRNRSRGHLWECP